MSVSYTHLDVYKRQSLNISAISLVLGEYAAPMGTGAALILLACGLFLWLQRCV